MDPRAHVPRPRGAARAAVAAGLVGAVAVAFGRVGGHGFVRLDDPQYVSENARVLAGLGWDNVRWALGTLHFSNWHPLTWLSYMLDVSLFGPSPAAMHLVNVALHAAAAVALLVALERMTGSFWRSAFVAALFALHPTRVESVAWISERKDVLSVLFGALALLAYERYTRRPSRGRYAPVLLAFAASLASKAMLVTLPLLLLLLDAWPLRRLGAPRAAEPSSRPQVTWRAAALEKVPLLVLAVAATAAGVHAQVAGGSVSPLPLAERIANAAVAYPAYVAKLAWPAGLAVLYPHPPAGWPAWRVAASAAAVLFATGWAIAAARRTPWAAVGWLWFVGTLVPVVGVVQLGAQSMADRYTYFPAVGLFVALAWSVPSPPPRLRLLVAAGASAVVLIAVVLTFRQAGLWADEERLYRHALAVTGPNPRAHALLATALRRSGRLEEAYAHALEAATLRPGDARDLANLGVLAWQTGRLELAERALASAVEADPGLSFAWRARAKLLQDTGRAAEALPARERVTALEPGDGRAWAELGIALDGAGRLDEAARAFDAARAAAPGDFEVQRNAGIFAARTRRWALAADAFGQAARLRPGDADVARRLADARARAAAGAASP